MLIGRITMQKPLAVVLMLEEQDRRQNAEADRIRAHWHELIDMHPMQRKERIDELLRPKAKEIVR
jgi:hypothetical protein